ncbi:hypothetical protein HanLR1_Chr16g0620801 [Helianthus annuus]|nr:hypothetical protein HanLR1_Chr16g0620801 [Helianthus annuus]
MNAEFVTFRGKDPNILQFNLFPRVYRNKDDLKLIQPLFHDFIPGSSFGDINKLRDSLQNSSNGVVNVTLMLIFFHLILLRLIVRARWAQWASLLIWVAYIALVLGFSSTYWFKFKRFRREDKVMRRIRNRKKAQERWDKLRKYVVFTWGRGSLPHEDRNVVLTSCCSGILIKSNQNGGSVSKRRQHIRKDTISFNKKVSVPDDKVSQKVSSDDVDNGIAHRQQPPGFAANDIPLPPSLEIKPDSEISASEIQKNLQNLYAYNLMLREELILAQSMLHSLTSNGHTPEGH